MLNMVSLDHRELVKHLRDSPTLCCTALLDAAGHYRAQAMIASHADSQSSTLGHNQDPGEKLTGAPDLVVEPSCESFQLLDLQQGSWSDDASEQEAVDADAVIVELMEATDEATQARCLTQLSSTSIPPYCILDSSSWQHLVQQLPWLLVSHEPSISAASQQLLMLQLAPELLTCSPEPLAQVLTALLTAATASNTSSTAQCTRAVARCSHSQLPRQEAVVKYPGPVVQLLVVGLHKLCRQWHFLDSASSQQLCNAVVAILLQPLHHLVSKNLQPVAAAASSDSKYGSQACLAFDGQPQQKQHAQQGQQQWQLDDDKQLDTTTPLSFQDSMCCCLADQLVLIEPQMAWLHRMNASSSSGVPFRAAVKDSDLCRLLHRQLVTVTHPTQGAPAHSASNVRLHPGSAVVASDIDGHASGSLMWCSSWSVGTDTQPTHCLLAHVMSMLVESPSGRRLLGQQSPLLPHAGQEGWQGDPPHPQASTGTQQQDHGLPLAEAIRLYLQSWVAYWNQAGFSDEAKASGSSDCGARASASSSHQQLGTGHLQLAAPSEVIEAAATAAHIALQYDRETSLMCNVRQRTQGHAGSMQPAA